MIKILGFEDLTASKQPKVLGRLLDVPEGRPRSNQEGSVHLEYSKTPP
jgi:hypothetical protein